MKITTCTLQTMAIDNEKCHDLIIERIGDDLDDNQRCPICNVTSRKGNYHHGGCENEKCALCGGQFLYCIHGYTSLPYFTDLESKMANLEEFLDNEDNLGTVKQYFLNLDDFKNFKKLLKSEEVQSYRLLAFVPVHFYSCRTIPLRHYIGT